MAIATTQHGADHPSGKDQGGGHHDTPAQRDAKERFALWLFIGGDAVLLALEVFGWFYLRGLNTQDMWRGAKCSIAKPCTDGLGNPLTHEVAKANSAYTFVIAAMVVIAAVLFWRVELCARDGKGRAMASSLAGLALLALAGAAGLQSFNFTALPFTTIDGTYASSVEFFMGSTLVHIVVLGFLALGVWNRARAGRYEDGNWHQTRLVRIFAVWIALSVCVLAVVMSLFA